VAQRPDADDGAARDAAEEARIERARWRGIGLALQFGSTVVGALLIGLGGGIWLDRKLHTSPLWLFVGLILAFVAIGYSLYELASIDTARRGAARKGASRRVAPPDDEDDADA
jgi:F0F1-type ATP synthase assembly protein I